MKQKKECTKKFEVYTASNADGIIVYIGSGAVGRHKHCTSGVSNVYSLNEMHFNKEELVVRVLSIFNTKEESMAEEKKLILMYRPIYNTQYLRDHRISKMNSGKNATEKLKEIIMSNAIEMYKYRRNKYLLRFIKFTDELIKHYKVSGLMFGVTLQGSQRLRGTEYGVYLKNNNKQSDLFKSIFEYSSGTLKIKDGVVKELQWTFFTLIVRYSKSTNQRKDTMIDTQQSKVDDTTVVKTQQTFWFI